VSAVSDTSALRRLGRSAFSLGAANAFDYAVQFLLPVVLVRCLDPEAFGQYRLVWLMIGTAMAFLPMALQGTLYYFLPRSDAATKRLYVNQTFLFFLAAGLLAGLAVSELDPWLPEKVLGLARSPLIVPAFVMVWVVVSLLDLLPTVEERISWQAKAIVGLALLRVVSISAVAAVTRDLSAVLLTLLAFAVVKLSLLLYYIARYHGLRGPFVRAAALTEQLRMAAPFWVGGALFGLRAQADQWVAATLFSLEMFASFSIALVLGPLVNLCRQSVSSAFLPSMSRYQAAGSLVDMLRLNSHANAMTASLVYPLLAFAFVFAEDLIAVVYTTAHLDAAPVMRVFTIGLAALVIELASVMLLLRLGTFMLWLNLVALLLSTSINWYSAQAFGLAGAAAGSVIVIYIDRAASLVRIARETRIPLRRLQDWSGLAVPLGLSVAAAFCAWAVVPQIFAEGEHFARAATGALVLGVTYASLRAACGMDRELHRAVRNLAHRF
jgi:O-antigen/teichoic acid export membrane protein